MNMISTGAFLPETDASTKQNELVKKLTVAWEKKNSKTARAGGASLMALSLAACGGEDNTPFSAADVADAEAAATTAALTAADGVTVYDSVDAAVTAGADAATEDMITEINTALGTSLTSADDAATVISTVQTSNDGEIAAAATTAAEEAAAATAATVAEAAAAELAAANEATAAAEAATASAEAATADLQTLYDALVASNATLQTAYDALITPVSSALTTARNVFTGTAADDTFTGTDTTYGDTDIITDSSTSDSDTLTLTLADETTATATVSGVENVVVNINAFGTSNGTSSEVAFDTDNYSNVTNLTFDVVRDNSTINKLDLENAIDGLTITTSDEFDIVDIDADDDASLTLVTAGNNIDAISTAGAIVDLTVSTTKATGAVAIDTDADGVVTATSSSTGTTTVTADDAATVVVTAGGVAAINADAASSLTASAAGTTTDSSITSDDGDLEAVTLSGNGAAVSFDLQGAEEIATITATGSQSVTAIVDSTDVTALTSDIITFVDNTTGGTTTLQFAAGGTAANVNTTAVAADVIDFALDMGGNTITAASGQTLTSTAAQGATIITAAAATASTNTVTLNIADDDTTASAQAVGAVDFRNMDSVTVNLLDAEAGHTITAIDFTSSDATINGNGETVTFASSITGGAITVANAGDVSFGTSALAVSSIDASGVTGAVDMDLDGSAAEPATVTTGDGDDTVTIETTADDYTVSTGAGDDTIEIDVSITTTNTVTIDGGAGSDTLAVGADVTLTGVTLSNISILSFDTTDATLTVGEAMVDGASYVIQGGVANEAITVDMDSVDVDLSSLVITNAGANQFVGEFTTDATGFTGSAMTITGSSTIDNITGGDKNDTLTGNGGVDVISGGAGADTISGGDGGDTLNGGTGNDLITGGAGDDTINGDGGADNLTGGAGDDTFDIDDGESSSTTMDVITDYEANAAANDNDTLDIGDALADGTGTATMSVTANIADAASVDISTADADGNLAANDVFANVTSGILTLSEQTDDNGGAAVIDTLDEWIDVALLALEENDTTAGAGGDTDVQVIAFEFSGSTYVIEVDDLDTADDTIAVNNIIQLSGLTGVTAVSSAAAAADTIFIA